MRLFFKTTASVVLVTFSALQISWAQDFELQQETGVYQPARETDPSEKGTVPTNGDSPLLTDSLAEDSALKPLEERVSPSYNPIAFRDALNDLRVDYAAAVPLEKHLSKEEWDKLAQHAQEENIEIAILVVPGEKKARTVLVTIGSTDEIMTSEAGRKFIDTWGRFVSHLHTDEHSEEGPTAPDLTAVPQGQTHYLRTPNQAYAYSNQGVTEALSFDSFFERYEEAIQKASEEEVDDSVVTNALNQLIAEQDRLNEHRSERKPWLAGGTVSPDSTLTSTNLTNFSGSPWVLLMPGSTSSTSVVQQSGSQFQVNYSVDQGSSGALVSFDNPTSSAIQVKDLSSYTDFVVGISGPSGTSVRVRVEDSLGGGDEVILTGITSSMQYYKIPKGLFTGINWTKVKNFTYSIDSTLLDSTAPLTGTLTLQTKTLLFSTTALTPFPGSPTPFVLDGSSSTTYLTEPTPTGVRTYLDLSPSSASFSGASFSFDDLWTPDLIETRNLSQGETLTVGLKAAASSIKKIRMEAEDETGATASLLLTGLTTGLQYYTVQKSSFSGTIDWSKVKRINFVIDRTLVTSSADYKRWFEVSLKGFSYQPTVNPTTGTISTLPGSPSLFLLPGSSPTTRLTEAGFTLSYDVQNPATFSGARINYDDPSTSAAIETYNFSTTTSLTFGLAAPSNMVRMKLVDINGKESSVLLTNVQATQKSFKVNLSLFKGIDKTQIQEIRFILDSVVANHAQKTGDLVVAINGLAAPNFSASGPGADPVNAVNETFTQILSGTKGRATGIAVNGTMVVLPDDSTTWSVEAALANEGINAFDIQETNGAGALGPVTQVSITRDTLPPTGSVQAVRFTDLTPDAVTLELALNGVERQGARLG